MLITRLDSLVYCSRLRGLVGEPSDLVRIPRPDFCHRRTVISLRRISLSSDGHHHPYKVIYTARTEMQYRITRKKSQDPLKNQLAATLLLRFRCSSAPLSFSSFVYNEEVDRCAVLSTIDVPSRKRARKRTLAFVKSPSLRETTMNCDPLNRVRNNWPMCCVCERSNAASISSRIYIGAGLNWSKAIIRERAIKDLHHFQVSCRVNRCEGSSYLCPPLSSVKLCFHTVPSWTFTSNPSMRSWPSGGWSFAKLPGKSSAKMPPKSLDLAKLVIRELVGVVYTCALTFSQVF